MRPCVEISGHQFASFRLDHLNQCLWQGTEQIYLSPKGFSVLRYLVERSGKLATKEELLDAVWPNVHVTEGVLKRAILEIRKALSDPIDEPLFIQTLHRRGYRFICPVTETAGSEPIQCELMNNSAPTLIGREQESRQTDIWFRDSLSGARRVVFLTGEMGIGKSALLEHWTESLAAHREALIGCGQCVPHVRDGEPYLPILEALAQLARRLGRRLVDTLHTYAPSWLLRLPALMSPEERKLLREEILDHTQPPALREIADALEALSQKDPLVLVLEDLQWSDAATIAFLSSIARRRGPARLMVLATFRMSGAADALLAAKNELELHRQCRELTLRPLNEEETGQYVESRFPETASNAVTNALYSRTAGNPLYLQCLVDSLSRSGRMESDSAIVWQTVPQSVHVPSKVPAALIPFPARPARAAA